MASWLFSTFTRSLQSALAKIGKISEYLKFLAEKMMKKGKNRSFPFILSPKLAECQRKTIHSHMIYKKIDDMEDIELLHKPSQKFNRLAFTVLAIEASAQKMGISPSEMRRRLDKVGLIKSLIQDCYDTLHTESREAVANDVIEALRNWEKEN